MNILTVADGHGHFYEEAVRIEAMGKPVPDQSFWDRPPTNTLLS